jgi:hypothetical protein
VALFLNRPGRREAAGGWHGAMIAGSLRRTDAMEGACRVRYEGSCCRAGLMWARQLMIRSVTLRTSITALRKVYSITSSARAISVGGTVNPSTLAVFKLTTSSNLLGCSIGKSFGFSPARIRPAYRPAVRSSSMKVEP